MHLEFIGVNFGSGEVGAFWYLIRGWLVEKIESMTYVLNDGERI